MSPFSEHQNDALKKAYDLLGEHFEHIIMAVSTTVNTEEGNGQEEANTSFYKGGRMAAIGLCENMKHELLYNTPKDPHD